jgi:CDP-glucose 4,6-dehydratase
MDRFPQIMSLPGPIFVTGHTGFKGSWLTSILHTLAIPWFGYSLEPDRDSLYCRKEKKTSEVETFADIRDYERLLKEINNVKPSVIIHLAAQSLVLRSYREPRYTFDVNVMGSVNVLEAARSVDCVKYVLVATTDKVYQNLEQGVPFKEQDCLGGHDPYSASKTGTEMAVEAWRNLQDSGSVMGITSARAGNVIGGGDFSENRLLPDLIRGFIQNKPIEIRNPLSVRPWQHVIDPLLGYLATIEHGLQKSPPRAVNFGPDDNGLSVLEVVESAQNAWGAPTTVKVCSVTQEFHEAENLDLNSDWARANLNWKNMYSQRQAVEATVTWWKRHLTLGTSADDLVNEEIINRFS